MKAPKQEKNVGGRKMGEPATLSMWDARRWKDARADKLLHPRVREHIERLVNEEGQTEVPYDLITVEEMQELLKKHGGCCYADFEVVIVGGEKLRGE